MMKRLLLRILKAIKQRPTAGRMVVDGVELESTPLVDEELNPKPIRYKSDYWRAMGKLITDPKRPEKGFPALPKKG